jgi:hypothetical protein
LSYPYYLSVLANFGIDQSEKSLWSQRPRKFPYWPIRKIAIISASSQISVLTNQKHRYDLSVLANFRIGQSDQYFVKQNLKYINRWRQWFYWVLILICNIFLGFDLRFYIFLQWLTFYRCNLSILANFRIASLGCLPLPTIAFCITINFTWKPKFARTLRS